MSNAVRYDPLLVRCLAAELKERLRGRGCSSAPVFGADRSVTLPLDGGDALRLDLHPTRGHILLLSSFDAGQPALDAAVEDVTAPPDERILEIHVRETGRFRTGRRVLVVELQTNQWNAILTGDDGRIVSALRTRRSRARTVAAGVVYAPPAGRARLGSMAIDRGTARSEWNARIAAAPAGERLSRMIAEFAYTGTINGDWILRGAAGRFEPDAAFERWWWIAGIPPARPVVLDPDGRAQPYPVPLDGVAWTPYLTLLDAMAAVATAPAVEAQTVEANRERAAELVARRMEASERRLEALKRELSRAGGADRIRAVGDLLLARMHEVRRGDRVARLENWEGEPVEVRLDPTLTVAENAARYYERARRKERAEARLPAMIAAAEAELASWREAARAIAGGEIPQRVARALAGPATAGHGPKRGASPPSLPYRRFRTSGGLEVRVGRGAKGNDRLTFGESAPDDVWLHAQSVPGSHVILRWPDAHASPPARDLTEAAQLAAVFSRARTSSTVAVVWTRRKYVRKPRGAPPGRVVPQRVRTVFVEPDETVVERLGQNGSDAA